jgi:glycosyltransferase involved in cell wall biosynthesis
MRALPELLQRRPHAQVLIVGGNEVSYGSRSPQGQTWQQIFLDEVKDRIDLSRVHFLGKVSYADFLSILQVSTVHVYLTYPFVLSWSLLEAMSCGCAIVASDTAPVRDVIFPGQTGQLVDFFDYSGLVVQTIELLNNPKLRQTLGENARALVQKRFDLHGFCLPRQIDWVNSLMRRL